jgi:hypothetical protein
MLGARAAELNVAANGDRRTRDGDPWLYVHAPNKRDAYIWLPKYVRETLALVDAYHDAHRHSRASDAPLLCHENGARLTSPKINRMLRAFFAKYFKTTDRHGNPVLYREVRGAKEPFDLNYSDLRHAAITEMSRWEQNPEHLRIFARH